MSSSRRSAFGGLLLATVVAVLRTHEVFVPGPGAPWATLPLLRVKETASLSSAISLIGGMPARAALDQNSSSPPNTDLKVTILAVCSVLAFLLIFIIVDRERKLAVVQQPTSRLDAPTKGISDTVHNTPQTQDMASDESELLAAPHRFDASELCWRPTGEVAISLRLNRQAGESWKLQVGNQDFGLAEVMNVSRLGPDFIALELADEGQIGFRSDDAARISNFSQELSKRKADYERFEQYDQESVRSYFQYYAKLDRQQNMLQDKPRTSTYQRAILENREDFNGKRALDLGAGSGILSFFAAQAGAEKVYAVEASSMGDVVRLLADSNDSLTQRIEVVNRPVETITTEIPEKVDVLVSEPIGTFLFNERMIESYLCARDRFLKPGGKMFPNAGTLCIAAFTDTKLYQEQLGKSEFWKEDNFYGVDLTAAGKRCTKEILQRPVCDHMDPAGLVSKYIEKRFDFATIPVESLQDIEMPFDFTISESCHVHGIAGWFDAHFDGTTQSVLLPTAPWCPRTHWKQTRFLLKEPLAVQAGQQLEGTLRMKANDLQSYHVSISMRIKETGITSESLCIDLKDPDYRSSSSPLYDALSDALPVLGSGVVLGLGVARAIVSQQAPSM